MSDPATDLHKPNSFLGLSMRLPPSNTQAEQSLLGAILANNKAYELVAEYLQPHHFADPVHGRIFEAIGRRINDNQVADPVMLRREFEHTGTLDEVGGVAYLANLLSAMVGIINAGDYGRTILDCWLRRELILACSETVELSFSPGDLTGQGVLEDLDGKLTRIADGSGEVKPLVHAGDAVRQAVELSMQAAESKTGLAGITTGYPAIDLVLGGLMNGQMYLAGARPAMGKTGLGLGIAARAATAGHHVMLWSGEMSAPQIGARLAAAHAGLDVMDVFRGKKYALPEAVAPGQHERFRNLDSVEWERLIEAQRDASNLRLHIDDRPGVTVSALRARARRLKRVKKLELLVVDYVGLMRATKNAEGRGLYEKMTELSSDLAKLAAELEIPMLVLAQLSREVEKRESKMPQLSDLRDSGGLEQDAYCVLFLHRPHYYLQAAGEPVRGLKETAETFDERLNNWHMQMAATKNLALVNVAKHRNGATGIRRLRFAPETIWFRDESEGDRDEAWGGAFMQG